MAYYPIFIVCLMGAIYTHNVHLYTIYYTISMISMIIDLIQYIGPLILMGHDDFKIIILLIEHSLLTFYNL